MAIWGLEGVVLDRILAVYWSNEGFYRRVSRAPAVVCGVLAGQQDTADYQYTDADGGDGDEDACTGRLAVSPVAQRTQQLGTVTRRHHQRTRRRHVGHCVTSPARDRKHYSALAAETCPKLTETQIQLRHASSGHATPSRAVGRSTPRPYMETSTRSTTCQMDRPTPPR